MKTIGRSTAAPPYVQWVVKVSKLCNLRCAYCYEFPSLADKGRMDLGQIRRMFSNIGDHFRDSGREMEFVWHGGEPLLGNTDFYWRIEELQKSIFDPLGIVFSNSVQTNLVKLTEKHLGLMRGFFKEIGVSIDLFGDQRVDVRGRQVQPYVLENMQRLKDEGVRFGCITVLSQLTAPHVDAICEFFEDIQVSFRLLPIYRTGFEGQQVGLALSDVEIVDALKKAIDCWFASDSFIRAEPVHSLVSKVLYHLRGPDKSLRYYDKEEGEVVFIVDTDGSLYSNGDTYDPYLRHGNIFRDSFSEMRKSQGFHRALDESRRRVSEACTSCRYHGSCSGFYVGEATPEQRWTDAAGRARCGVAAPLLEYIEIRLIDAGLVDLSTNKIDDSELWRRSFGDQV
jgi:uncharacterized protein